MFYEGISGFDQQSDISVAQLSDASQSNSLGLEEDDLFQCGKCKQSFTSISFFLTHKKECLKKGKSSTRFLIPDEDIEKASRGVNLLPSPARIFNESSSSLLTSNIIQISESDYLSLTNNLDSGNNGLNLGDNILGTDTLSLLPAGSPAAVTNCGLDSLNNLSPPPISSTTTTTFPVSFFTSATALYSSSGPFLLSTPGASNQESNDSLSSIVPTSLSTSISSNIFLNISNPLTNDKQSSTLPTSFVAVEKSPNNLSPSSKFIKTNNFESLDEIALLPNCSKNELFTIQEKEDLKSEDKKKIFSSLKTEQSEIIDPKKASKLKCNFCDRAFNKNFDLQQHIRCHTGEKPFQCVVCGRAFAQKSNVKKHMQTHKVWPDGLANTLPCIPGRSNRSIDDKLDSALKNGTKNDLSLTDSSNIESLMKNIRDTSPVDSSYACPYCSYTGKTYFELKSHMKTHKREKVYKCILTSCGKMFVDLEPFLDHMHIHENEMTYSCHLCSKTFNSLCELGDHQHSHPQFPHQGAKSGQRYYRCSKCLNKYTTPAALEHHVATSSHRYPCPHCNKLFPCERYLRRHLLTHGSCLHICQFCDKTFKTANYLKVHLVIHTGEKPYVCNICSAAFNRPDKLKRHKLVHDPVKRFKCPFRIHTGCQKEFNRHDKLKAHMLTHCGIKPHKCSECNRLFSRKAHLRSHMASHANTKESTISKDQDKTSYINVF